VSTGFKALGLKPVAARQTTPRLVPSAAGTGDTTNQPLDAGGLSRYGEALLDTSH
jgi:hypothetical protein